MSKRPFSGINALLADKVSGASALRKQKQDEELEHERQIAAIRAGSPQPAIAPWQVESIPALSRKEFVMPILEAKGWSLLDWANEAGVSYHAASDYVTGARSPYASTRAKLAKVLGVSVQQLPK